MWDYKSPYFSFPFLASAGAYSFKRTESGYDLKDIGVDNAGAVKALKESSTLSTRACFRKAQLKV